MLISVSLLKQPRDGVMGCAAECIGADDSVELPEAVIAEYPEEPTSPPIPQIPYVETGNAGERGFRVFEPDGKERVAGGGLGGKRMDRREILSAQADAFAQSEREEKASACSARNDSPSWVVEKNEEARG
jgi:hypothetical protein